MKKVLAILVFCLFGIVLSTSSSSAKVVDSGKCGDNATYELDDEGNLTISGSGDVDDEAFCREENIVNVRISEGITSMGDRAFRFCTYLTSINLPNSLTSIGDCAFWHCASLTSITIPEGVTSIRDRAFFCCESLTSITIPEGVTSIGDYAFFECTSLTSINLPNSLTSIGDYAFSECTSLTSITIPEGVTSIGVHPFADCSGLESIRVNENNTVYDSRKNCNAIIETKTNCLVRGCKNTIIPEGVTSIGEFAFDDCTSLTSITIPEGVTSIGESAFGYCTSLTSITIPEGVTSIGDCAFRGCTRLTSITIPEGVTSIGGSAFYECSRLTSITIPEGVTSIGAYAFDGCTSLTSITIPEGVTSICYSAFYECSSLTTIYCEANKPGENWDEYWLRGCDAKVIWGYKSQSNFGQPSSDYCTKFPSFSSYCDALDKTISKKFTHSVYTEKKASSSSIGASSYPIPGLATTNFIQSGSYYNNDMYVPQGICRMGDYILISAYQQKYSSSSKSWTCQHPSVIYVLDADSHDYRATLVLPNTYHNGGIAFDGANVWLTNTSNASKVYSIKKEVINEKISEVDNENGPYSAPISSSDISSVCSIDTVPSCLNYYNGQLWVGQNDSSLGTIRGYIIEGKNTDKPSLVTYSTQTINTSKISLGESVLHEPTLLFSLSEACSKINGFTFDSNGDLFVSVSGGRKSNVRHIIKFKHKGSDNTTGAYSFSKKVLVPDMSEEIMIEGDKIYTVFESGARKYRGDYGKGPDIITERVLAFDKGLWGE